MTAFSVGAVLVDADDTELATGFSRETDPHVHAEESALTKINRADPRLPGATMYSSLEPCSKRKSRPIPCARLIIDAGIRRVVFAWREPAIFVDGDGRGMLAAAGVEVIELTDLTESARMINEHLLAK